MEHRRYDYTNEQEFLADMANLEHGLPYSSATANLAHSYILPGGFVAKNRLVAQPLECADADVLGAPTPRTIERYCRVARGGWGVIWVEACGVSDEGKSREHQLRMSSETVERFAELVRKVREAATEAPFIVLQLTHSGRDGTPALCAYDNPLNTKQNWRIISDSELETVRDDYVAAAVLARQAGFDGVDIRACHGYLLSELLSAYSRSGKYGGSLENRARLLLDTVRAVRAAVPNLAVGVRLGVYDGLPWPYGFGASEQEPNQLNLTEPVWVARQLVQCGVSMINVSAGIGAVSPQVLRPYDKGKPSNEHPLEGIERLLNAAKAIKQAVPNTPIIASGFTWARTFASKLAAGGIEQGWFDFAGFGRQWLANPNYANEVLQGKAPSAFCKTCGACSARLGAGKSVYCAWTTR